MSKKIIHWKMFRQYGWDSDPKILKPLELYNPAYGTANTDTILLDADPACPHVADYRLDGAPKGPDHV